MNFSLFRRLAVLACMISSMSAGMAQVADTQQIKPIAAIQKKLADLETSSGGRLGLFAINTANNARIQYRGVQCLMKKFSN